MTAYFGYTRLQASVSPVSVSSFRQQHCVVPGVGHEEEKMWQSTCGGQALRTGSISAIGTPARPGATDGTTGSGSTGSGSAPATGPATTED